MEFIKYDAPLSGEIKGIDLNNIIYYDLNIALPHKFKVFSD